MRLLFVTDHRIDTYLVKALREAGHVVDPTDQPADGLVMAATDEFQVIVLDWEGPARACAAHYAAASQSLVVAIIASADEVERAAVLKSGADACFTRPAPFIELEARLEALERLTLRLRSRTDPAADTPSAEMIPARRAVRLGGQDIALSGREYRVMAHLVAHAGEVVGLDRLQLQLFGDAAEPRPDLVQASLSRLRRKLAAAGLGAYINLVAGHGYIFRALTEVTGTPAHDEHENRLIRPTASV